MTSLFIDSVQGLLAVAAGLAGRLLIGAAALAVLVLPALLIVAGYVAMTKSVAWAEGLRRVSHVMWSRACFYAPGHLWLRPLGHDLRVGIDDLAQRLLPEITALALVPGGTTVRAGDHLADITCANAHIVLRAPIDGTVTGVNERAVREPALLHTDPFRGGWLVDVRPQNRAYATLPSKGRARAWMESEDRRLAGFFERSLGVAAAERGELGLPPHKLLTADQWRAISTEFLGRS